MADRNRRPSAPDVRPAGPHDESDLAVTLARAFHDDPFEMWLMPDERTRLGRAERFYAGLLRRSLRRGDRVLTVEGCHGVALWAPPGRWRWSALEVLRMTPVVARALGLRLFRSLTALSAIERIHPSEEHWYLAVLGTDPEHQGRGIGSSVMQPVLDECDATGMPAYLESSKERNLPFYERHGFEVVTELRVGRGAPPVWPMRRGPRVEP